MGVGRNRGAGEDAWGGQDGYRGDTQEGRTGNFHLINLNGICMLCWVTGLVHQSKAKVYCFGGQKVKGLKVNIA